MKKKLKTLKKKYREAQKEIERLNSANKTYLTLNFELQTRVKNLTTSASSSSHGPTHQGAISTNVRDI